MNSELPKGSLTGPCTCLASVLYCLRLQSTLDWISETETLALSFPSIVLHAVSRDVSAFPFKPCIFILYSITDDEDSELEVTKTYRLSPDNAEQRVCEIQVPIDCCSLVELYS